MAQAEASTTIDHNMVWLRQHITIDGVNTMQKHKSFIDWDVLTQIDNFKAFSRKDTKMMVYLKTSQTHELNIESLIYWIQDKEKHFLSIELTEWTHTIMAQWLMDISIADKLVRENGKTTESSQQLK